MFHISLVLGGALIQFLNLNRILEVLSKLGHFYGELVDNIYCPSLVNPFGHLFKKNYIKFMKVSFSK